MTNKKLSTIESGSESLVQLAVATDGTRSIIKTQRPGGTVNYMFEAFAYSQLAALGVRVPKVISVSSEVLEMSAFGGETLDDLTDLYYNPDVFDEAAHDLALARQLSFTGFGTAVPDDQGFAGTCQSWQEFLDNALLSLRASKLLPQTTKDIFVDYWNKVAPHIQLPKGMLVHGDFSLSSVFVRDGQYEGLIDFGDAFIGDPLMDLAYFRFKELTKDYGPLTYNHLVKAYIENTQIDPAYLEKAVRLYMIYWAVARTESKNLESDIIAKFLDKARVLADLL